ncbi:MAG: hypothetical protein U0R50_13280 [Gaiellales bacterium]
MLDLASPRVRAALLVALGLGAGGAAYLLVERDGGATSTPPLPPPAKTPLRPRVPAISARLVTADQLKREAATSSHPVYWAGPRAGVRYELTRQPDGRTYVRYLTGFAGAGDAASKYVMVATYPQAAGFSAIAAEAQKAGNTRIDLPAGGVAVVSRRRPKSVYLSYPGADYQVEVFAPRVGEATKLVRTGKVRPLGGGTPVATGEAVGLTLPALRLAARTEAFFWVGPRPGVRYELTQTPEGHTFVRYLPANAQVGDRRAGYLTVATYPAENALAQVRSVRRNKGTVTLKLKGGGLAVYSRSKPDSVFVAFPKVPFQIEVFSPRRGEARSLVTNARIVRAR